MARRTKKSPKDYPKVIAFDENLEGAANIIEVAQLSIPEIWKAVKGATDHELAITLNELITFFTSDRHWLTRQPPYKHGGIVFLDTGNSPVEEKAKVIIEFLGAFHLQNKSLDMLRNRRFRLTRNGLFEAPIGQREKRIA
ncbi:hypothetical protein ES703_52334 [subsurface metagenome]